MARRAFTNAFKLEAVRLLDSRKQPAAASARETTIALSDEQVRSLGWHTSEVRNHNVESSRPSELINQNTFC